LSVIENGRVLIRNNVEIVAYPSASGSIEMSNVTSIARGAFSETAITEANFPLVVYIGMEAFWNSGNLVEIYIPMATTISDFAFQHCNNLSKVTLGTVDSFSDIFTFPGNLRDVYLNIGGGAGTYTTTNPGSDAVWVKE
jgi:hypothetical protein